MASAAIPPHVARLLGLFVLAGAAGCDVDCGRGAPPARAWPTGTVLALNGEPILEAEVDAVGSMVARSEPQYALPHLRRVALTNVVLSRTAARQVAGERRAQALALACERKAALESGTPVQSAPGGPAEQMLEGGLGVLGLEVWNWALDAQIGRWSDPIEVLGCWRLVRVIERGRAATPIDVQMRVASYSFPYVTGDDALQKVEAHLDRSKLVFVDEAWRDVVPTAWQRRLRGGSP